MKSWNFLNKLIFSTLTRRILALNIAALVLLCVGVLHFGNFQRNLVKSKLISMTSQADIIADAISATVFIKQPVLSVTQTYKSYQNLIPYLEQIDSTPALNRDQKANQTIAPQTIALNDIVSLVRDIASHRNLRLRLYNQVGEFLLDTKNLSNADLPRLPTKSLVRWALRYLYAILPSNNLITQSSHGEQYYVQKVLSDGIVQSWSQRSSDGQLLLYVAQPIDATGEIYGALVLSSSGDDIEHLAEVAKDKILLFMLTIVAIFAFLSLYLAYTIATPMRKLSYAAEKASNFVNPITVIPQFNNRYDEINHLAQAIDRMNSAFYNHLEKMASFAQDVSHELKNPLTSLTSALETLQNTANEKHRTRLQEIMLDDVKRMNLLITDISDASKVEAQLAHDKYSDIDLKEIITSRLESAIAMTKDKTINYEIKTSPQDDDFIFHGHPLRIEQVFDNMIANAISFLPEQDANLTIYIKKIKNTIELIFEDNGGGIKAVPIEKIFERFYTNRKAENKDSTNSGLGLSITKQIIESHSGNIRAENIIEDGKTIGARFIIELPQH